MPSKEDLKRRAAEIIDSKADSITVQRSGIVTSTMESATGGIADAR